MASQAVRLRRASPLALAMRALAMHAFAIHTFAILAAALLAFAAGGRAEAHRANFALTSIEWNAEAGSLEVIHRLHTHHALDAVRLESGAAAPTLEDTAALAMLGVYVQRRFDIRGPDDAPIALEFVGAEVEGDYALVYQEAVLPRPPDRVAVRDDILADVLEDQINHVNVRLEGPVATLMFREAQRGRFLATGRFSIDAAGGREEDKAMTAGGLGALFGRYLVLGVEHITPKGLDHILFVLGLFFSATALRPLLLQATAFTLAHSITLALATMGLAALPPSVVEPLIALSIAYIGVENCLFRSARPWRVIVVFAFGLLHGLGFAGVLMELGLPPGGRAVSLLGFNVGVEIGQVAVLLAAWLVLRWFFNRPDYRRFVQAPASAAIAIIGVFWTVERALGV